ncbi:MAG: flavin reductase family protein [Actinobacteria bacterium]|nr:MAG: flavin reductase family protein [Actinomycetota bacterium]
MGEIDARAMEGDLPSAVILLTAAEGERRNVMPATQVVLLSYEPPLVGVAVTPSHLTYELIEAGGYFAINVATAAQAPLVRDIGHSKGREIDKFEAFGIETARGDAAPVPLITGSMAAMECRLLEIVPAGDHHLIVGEVLAHHHWSDGPPLMLVGGRLT